MFENVDVSRLTRDYTKEPLAFGEKPKKEDMVYLYIELNLSLDDLASYFKCSNVKIKRVLRYHKVTKSKEQHYAVVRRNLIAKYGVDHVSHIAGVSEKRKATCMDKYGVPYAIWSAEIRKQCEQTCMKRYGVKRPLLSASIQQRCRETTKRRYGVVSPLQNPDIKERARRTHLARYGVASAKQKHLKHVDVWFNDELFTQYILAGNDGKYWTTAELCAVFNTSISNVNKHIKSLGLHSYIDSCTSQQEKMLTTYLHSLGVHTDKFRENRVEFDIYVPDRKLAIEYNGDYWHGDLVRDDKKYHLKKTQYAESKGITLYHVFSHDWFERNAQVKSQIRNLLGLNTTTIYARKCSIQEVGYSESKLFLEDNHLQGACTDKVRIGLYYRDSLVAIMTFGKPRFNTNCQWELVRFCCKSDTSVVGGASRLFQHFIKEYKPTSIISYSDIAKTTGKMYSTLGFVLQRTTVPNYIWAKHDEHYTRYQCQKHKLVEQGFGTLGDTEDAIMRARGFYKVYDCGNRVHIWECKR